MGITPKPEALGPPPPVARPLRRSRCPTRTLSHHTLEFEGGGSRVFLEKTLRSDKTSGISKAKGPGVIDFRCLSTPLDPRIRRSAHKLVPQSSPLECSFES